MADHKAPTQVTVVPHEEKSGFAVFIEAHWMKAALLAVLVSAAILVNQWQSGQETEAVDASWTRLMSAVELDVPGAPIGDPQIISGMEPELEGTIAAPWALFLKARGLREEGNYDEAVAALLEIKAKFPEHPLVKDTHLYGESVTPLSAVEHLSKVFNGEAEWHRSQPELFENPEPAPDAPRVRIQTDYGDIVVAIYSDRAPLHSENFLKLAGEGFYNGIKFHRNGFGQMIEAGDPTTKEAESDPPTWGRQGAEHTVENEETGLSNFTGFLAALKLPPAEGSNGSLFAITAMPVHYQDGNNVVFGKVMEGMDVVEEIVNLPNDQTAQRPAEPATIQSMTVLPGV